MLIKDPFEQFENWYQESPQEGMTLATVDEFGIPDARIVLLKKADHNGFVFFTNYHSVKAKQLESNPVATCVFWWSKLQRQVRIKGSVSKIAPTDSETYFKTRPRGSQIGAWASHQSEILLNRVELENAYAAFEKKYAGQEVPRPEHWGGYCLKPHHFEFWQGRDSRLHDRFEYDLNKSGVWEIKQLAP